MHGSTVVYSIPPVTSLPPGHAIRAALQAAYGGGAACFIYLSSCGLYGSEPDDETWIDEDTPLAPDAAMQNVRSDELEIERSNFELRTVVLRLAPVYGPGRGVRDRMKKGQYKILDDGEHATSRIHVDDVVRIVVAAEQRAPDKALFLVGDDEPTTQGEYARWLSARLGVPMPPSRPIIEPGSSRVAHRNRKIRNAKLKQTLGVELAYPSFREGEASIEAELG
jgi:nucleoside-diphosphate-sugar epimerase